MSCGHRGRCSGAARYMRASGHLRLVLVCDECGAERTELDRISYSPHPQLLLEELADLTARELGLDDARVARVRIAAQLCRAAHDRIPHEILVKKGPLSEREWAAVRRHPELAATLLVGGDFDDIRSWVRCYRERPDGRGYPRGLRDGEIPLEALILAVADAYVAMMSERPYRARRAHVDACLELRRGAGTQFDASVVEAFLRSSVWGDLRLLRTAA